MRIGILTLPLEMNYGGILQAYALQQVLQRKGHDVTIIDRHNRRQYPSFSIHLLGYLKRLKEHYLDHKSVSVNWNPFMDDTTYRLLSANTRDFVCRNMKLTREVWSDQLKEIEEEYKFDAYVVGSDQVWLAGYYPSSFLDFVTRDQVVKMFYAASCNEDNSFFSRIKDNKECLRLASQFKGISVREDSLLKLCSEVLGRQGEHVLDPTLLLDRDDYLSIVKSNMPNQPCVFSYILDKSGAKQMILQSIEKIYKVPIVAVNSDKQWVKGGMFSIEECIKPSVDDWLNNLSCAEFVVTDSFHGTCFAILFHKQFIVVGNSNRGINRFRSLLKMFNLEDRMVIEPIQMAEIQKMMNKRIDYKDVDNRLGILRSKSNAFIDNCLI